MKIAAFTAGLPEYTPEDAVEALSSLGFDGVEWRVVDQGPWDGEPSFWFGNRCTLPLSTLVDDAPRVRALVEGHGLAMPNLGTYVACSDPEAVEHAMRAAVALGAPSIRVTLPGYDGSAPYLPERDAARRQWDTVAMLAANHGVRALLELHMDTIIPSASAAASFLHGLDPAHVGVIHDAGNMVFEGHERYRMSLEVLGPYLAHVHIKNATWSPLGARPDGSTQWAPAFAPLTAGIVDVPSLLRSLRDVGYDGWISLEDFSTAQPVYERTRDDIAYLRKALAAGT
ncbi:MAG: sugar phosphate isomerase/epimerase [Acidimicrobiia bacterium]|nr:sugar phosphate isomerase/epimerase [Acidimicrobiia bacterium]